MHKEKFALLSYFNILFLNSNWKPILLIQNISTTWPFFDLHIGMWEDAGNLVGPLDRARFYHWAAVDSYADRNFLFLTGPPDKNLYFTQTLHLQMET
jgi:hypothetical protein